MFVAATLASQMRRPEVTPIVVQMRRCLAVCDTIEATVSDTGRVTRSHRGQVLGPGRVPVRVAAFDTVFVGSAAVDSLVAAIDRYVRHGFPAAVLQGFSPCSNTVITDGAIYSITWRDGANRRSVAFDISCDEPSGLLRALAIQAAATARFQIPAGPR
jgi:hypothetical protein